MIRSLILEEALSWAKMIVFVVVSATFINHFIIVNALIPSGSMENAIMPGDRIVAFRLSYLFTQPDRFDIVVFRYPNDETRLYVKRIIGLPGETVTITDGLVFIDGQADPLRDDFIRDTAVGSYGPFVVPLDSYFMLGDNRGNSEDSRAWDNPFVHRDGILGRAIFRYWRGFGVLR